MFFVHGIKNEKANIKKVPFIIVVNKVTHTEQCGISAHLLEVTS